MTSFLTHPVKRSLVIGFSCLSALIRAAVMVPLSWKSDAPKLKALCKEPDFSMFILFLDTLYRDRVSMAMSGLLDTAKLKGYASTKTGISLALLAVAISYETSKLVEIAISE